VPGLVASCDIRPGDRSILSPGTHTGSTLDPLTGFASLGVPDGLTTKSFKVVTVYAYSVSSVTQVGHLNVLTRQTTFCKLKAFAVGLMRRDEHVHATSEHCIVRLTCVWSKFHRRSPAVLPRRRVCMDSWRTTDVLDRWT